MKIFSKFKQLSLVKKILCIVLVIFIVAIVAGMGSDNSNDGNYQSDDTVVTDDSAKEDDTVSYGICDVVNVEDVEYLVSNVSVTKSVGDQYLSNNANDTYLVIDISITNHGNEALSISDSFFKLLNGGNEYSTDSTGAIYLGDTSIIYKEINPEVTLQGQIIFDVPEAVANDMQTQLQVQTGYWGSATEVISLSR